MMIIVYISTVKENTRKWLEAQVVPKRRWKWNLSIHWWILGSERASKLGRLPWYI